MIPYGRQDVRQADIDAVVEVLRSDFLTQGDAVPAFETAVARMVGAAHAVAVNSATSALHIACIALGLAQGGRLWTVPNTFVASANCGLYCGARIDFVDIDERTWNLSVTSLREKLRLARISNTLPDIVVPVHFGGQPTDQEEIWELGQEFGFRIIEDASHSIGASVDGELVGSCRWSDVTIFSFHPVKIITSGEGGMAVTSDTDIFERMRLLRSHGITRDPTKFIARGADRNCKTFAQPAWYYEQQVLGFNYRMTDIQAALGLSQLNRIQHYIARRNELAIAYGKGLANLPLQLPYVAQAKISAFHLYVVRLLPGSTPAMHRSVFDGMRSRGIGVNLHYQPVHLQPFYRQMGFKQGAFPQAEHHGCSAITLPMYPGLTSGEQSMVIGALKESLISMHHV